MEIAKEVEAYNQSQNEIYAAICNALAKQIAAYLPEAENKVWHRHPVWFLEGNPIVGYSKEKRGLRLMFWSGVDFDESLLNIKGGKFKDASIFYQTVADINNEDLKRWIEKSRNVQWDYKNIVKRKGILERLK